MKGFKLVHRCEHCGEATALNLTKKQIQRLFKAVKLNLNDPKQRALAEIMIEGVIHEKETDSMSKRHKTDL